MLSNLPCEIEIMGMQFTIQYLDHKVGVFNCNSLPGTILDRNMNPLSDGFLFLINGKCVSVTWNKNLFLFDSRSRDSTGKSNCEGAASLIKFNSKNSIELFIIENFLYGEENVQFELQHVSFNKENKKVATVNYQVNRRRMFRNDPIAKAKERKQKLTPERKEKTRLYKATPEVKEKIRLYKASPEGPYFICVVCNRCMYRRSVQSFDEIKYDLQYSYLFITVQSFDSNFYICLNMSSKSYKK